MEMNVGKDNISVAVFDSGIGGLNLLKECSAAIPNARLYYLADNYNVPYGSKSKDEILKLVKDKFSLISDVELSAAVIACNTATSNCIDEIRSEYSFPVIGIQPAIKPAAEYGGRCLVLATRATVASRSFNDLLLRCKKNSATDFIIHPCEGLAEYVENNIFNLGESLPEGTLPDVEVDSVVLGCTHYAYVKDIIRGKYKCKIFDGIGGTIARLMHVVGIDNHLCTQIGISDPLPIKMPIITFLGGNFDKNARIFAQISK